MKLVICACGETPTPALPRKQERGKKELVACTGENLQPRVNSLTTYFK